MSDDNAMSPEGTADAPAAHPTTAGKSLATYEKPRYKSWRKKYRKLHAHFDTAYEENRSLFKEEQRLEAVAKRLREEIDGLLELCLDINQNPSIPPELRFDVSLKNPPSRVSTLGPIIPPNITPEEANARSMDYQEAMRNGKVKPLDAVDMRMQMEARLAAQGVQPLSVLEESVSRPVEIKEESEVDVEKDLAFMPFDEEMEYLSRLDARLAMNGTIASDHRHRDVEQEKYYADLTPRELERKTEFDNPQSQHNWLKTHTKVLNVDEGDTESLASGEPSTANKNKRKSGAGKGNLAKQVGDRAVKEARDGSAAPSNDEDELASTDLGALGASAGKKRARDPDGTYRVKGGKSAAAKGKRKRSGEDVAAAGGSGGKRARVESGEGTPVTPGGGGASA